jgi:hypothetical protein
VKHCPEWVFSAVVALVAQRYLLANLSLSAFATKYAQVLGERFAPVEPVEIESAAEGCLRVLVEANADDALGPLNSFAHQKIAIDAAGAPRKIRRLFGSELDGSKTQEYSAERTVKEFKPFLYMLRAKPEFAAPAGWNWTKIEDGDWLCKLPEVEVTFMDGL